MWIKNSLKVTVVWSCDAVQFGSRRLWPFSSPVDPLTSLVMIFIFITGGKEVTATRIICLFLRSVHKYRHVWTFFFRLTGTYHIPNKISLVSPAPHLTTTPVRSSFPYCPHLKILHFSGCLLITECTWTCMCVCDEMLVPAYIDIQITPPPPPPQQKQQQQHSFKWAIPVVLGTITNDR